MPLSIVQIKKKLSLARDFHIKIASSGFTSFADTYVFIIKYMLQ